MIYFLAKKYKKNLKIRLKNDKEGLTKPVFSATNIDYEIPEKIEAISYGEIGLIDQLTKSISLSKMINRF